MVVSILIVIVALLIGICVIFVGVRNHNTHHTQYRDEHHHLFKHYFKHQKDDEEHLRADEKELLEKLNSVQSRLKELMDYKVGDCIK